MSSTSAAWNVGIRPRARLSTDIERVPRQYRAKSLLTAVLFSIGVPLGAIAVGGAYYAATKARTSSDEAQIEQVEMMAAMVDIEVGRAEAFLQGLNTLAVLSPELSNHLGASIAGAKIAADERLSLVLPDGRIVQSSVKAGERPFRLSGLVLTAAASEGWTGITNLYFGPNTGALRIAVVQPVSVQDEAGDRPRYSLVYGFPPKRLSTVFAPLNVAAGGVASILDRNGATVMRSRATEQFAGAMADPLVLSQLASKRREVVRTSGPTGQSISLAVARAPRTGFAVTLTFPDQGWLFVLPNSWELAGLLASLIIAASFGVATFRRLTAASGSLTGTTYLTKRAVAPPPRSDLAEFDDVMATLTASAASRRAALETMSLQHAGSETSTLGFTKDKEGVQERLNHAHRMEALGVLASGVAHDFGNVLQIIGGNAAVIRDQGAGENAVNSALSALEGAVQQGSSVVRRLLAFAREDVLKTADCDVGEILSGVADMLAHLLSRNIRVSVDAPEQLPFARADRSQLETVLLNIATNARDAMPSGGCLTFTARLVRCEDRGEPMAAALQKASQIRIDAMDTGTGMSRTTLARAAEPFFTTKDVTHGTGLGLAMARGFAEQSGGAFEIASELGRGTVVSLWLPTSIPTLPALPAKLQLVTPSASEGEPAGQGRKRIVLLDDLAAVRDPLARQLGKRGLDVVVCSSAAEAIGVFEGAGGIDLLITDLAMPDMTGEDLITRVHTIRPGLPVILLTGHPYDAEEFVKRHTGPGALRLMGKPASGNDIFQAVADMLRRQAV